MDNTIRITKEFKFETGHALLDTTAYVKMFMATAITVCYS